MPAPAPVEMHVAQPVVRDQVVLTPTQSKQAVSYEAPAMPEPARYEEPLPESAFIPPQAERTVVRPARMPRVDELPMPAQNQIRASRGDGEPAHDQKRMTLLQRLATVGFGRKDEPQGQAPAPAEQPMPTHRSEPPRSGMSPVHAEYTKRQAPPQGHRPAQGQLDPHGRMAPARSAEDDQLEIPAFLRRQAN
jgi:cell division protein FtsZ